MKAKKKEKNADDYYNLDDLKNYMALPAKEKLNSLERLNAFFVKAVPAQNKAIWQRLKKIGW
jgi:hypothetical protein